MAPYYGPPGPPRTLSERLSRLNDSLQSLGDHLKASIAGLLGDAIADAVRDSVRGLLGGRGESLDPHRERSDHHSPGYYRDDEADPWGDEDRPWREEDFAPARPAPAANGGTSSRWQNAVGAALRAALWLARRQPRRRPVLTTLCLTLAAGVTGFLAGPVLATGAAVFASVAGLVFTADAAKSAAELAAG